jgi:aspartyl aminopeptidase
MKQTEKKEKILAEELLDLIQRSPCSYFAVKEMSGILKKAGFTELSESEKWKLEKGGKYYTLRNGSSVIAFTIPKEKNEGYSIVASHSDSPSFRLKDTPEIKTEGRYTKLNTEGYGGMIISSWFDRPLSVAGRAVIKTKNGIKNVLVNIDRDLLIIPNLAIHIERTINDGYKYNLQKDTLPLLGDEKADLKDLIAKEAGVDKKDLLSSDLYLYPRGKGTFIGANEEYISSPRLDDLECAFLSVKAIAESSNDTRTAICAVFDNEEVGSGTRQGAASTFLADVINRIGECLGDDHEQTIRKLSASFMLSADNAHAIHPNHTDRFDETNRNYMNGGVVVKFNASQKYTSDALSAGLFKYICESEKVPYQIFHNRSDLPGGSTLGNISSRQVSISTVDIGLAQLAMHSCYETAGTYDLGYMQHAMRAFLDSEITSGKNGEYTVKTKNGGK